MRSFKIVGLLLLGLFVNTAANAQGREVPTTCPDKVNGFCICTGDPELNYYRAGQEIAGRIPRGMFSGGVHVLRSEGSVQNIRNTEDGNCHMSLVQADVLALYFQENDSSRSLLTMLNEVVYREYMHLICRRNTFDRINAIGKAKGRARVAVGSDMTGPNYSMRYMREADRSLYSEMQTLPLSGDDALAEVRNRNGDTCALIVSGLNSPVLRRFNDVGSLDDKRQPTATLINLNDGDIIKRPSISGSGRMYEVATITRVDPDRNGQGARMYNNLMANRTVDTLTVPASAIANTKLFQEMNGDTRRRLRIAIDDSLPSIRAMMAQPAGN